MIPLLVFYVHIVALAALFTRRWQEEGAAGAFLAAFFFGLIFFVGWSISTFLMKLIMEQEGFGTLLDRDALALLFLTAGECILYYFYFRDSSTPANPASTEAAPIGPGPKT